MRTKIFLDGNTGPIEVGLITDSDIFAFEGQKVMWEGKELTIMKIYFVMKPAGSNISTEKHMLLGEVTE